MPYASDISGIRSTRFRAVVLRQQIGYWIQVRRSRSFCPLPLSQPFGLMIPELQLFFSRHSSQQSTDVFLAAAFQGDALRFTVMTYLNYLMG